MFFVLKHVYGDAAILHLKGGCFSLPSLRGALLMFLVLQDVYGDAGILPFSRRMPFVTVVARSLVNVSRFAGCLWRRWNLTI
jgi:hypothetical protein